MFCIYSGPISDVLIGKNAKYITLMFEKALQLQGYLFQSNIYTSNCMPSCFHTVLCMITEMTIC